MHTNVEFKYDEMKEEFLKNMKQNEVFKNLTKSGFKIQVKLEPNSEPLDFHSVYISINIDD